jgi:hypothetical protein
MLGLFVVMESHQLFAQTDFESDPLDFHFLCRAGIAGIRHCTQ